MFFNNRRRIGNPSWRNFISKGRTRSSRLYQGTRANISCSLGTDHMVAYSCVYLDRVSCAQLVRKGAMSRINFIADPPGCWIYLVGFITGCSWWTMSTWACHFHSITQDQGSISTSKAPPFACQQVQAPQLNFRLLHREPNQEMLPRSLNSWALCSLSKKVLSFS